MASKKAKRSLCLQEALASGEEKTIAELVDELLANSQVQEHDLLRYPADDKKNREANRKAIERDMQSLMAMDFPDKRYIRNEQQRPTRYRVEARFSREDNPQSLGNADFSVAVALALNDKFAKAFMPSAYYQQFVDEVSPGSLPDAVTSRVRQLKQRVAVMQRSKSLEPARPFPRKQLDLLYQALLDHKKIDMCYADRDTQVLPIGVVFREPKIFLVGRTEAPDVRVKIFSVNKISRLSLGESFNPQSLITLDEYLASHAMDFGPPQFAARVNVVLEITAGTDNLIADVQQHRLSARQKNKQLANRNLQITLPNEKITYQLMEWIVGRMERVVVKRPDALRLYLRERLELMLGNYR